VKRQEIFYLITFDMLNINFIRENQELIIERLKIKNFDAQNIINFWKKLTGEYKLAFLKELVRKKKDTTLISKLMKHDSAISEYVKDLILGK